MNLIDFHCDTLSECYNRKSELYKNDLHIDLERGKRVFNKYCQVFAIWIPDEKRGDEAYAVSYTHLRAHETRHTTILIMFTLSLKNSF